MTVQMVTGIQVWFSFKRVRRFFSWFDAFPWILWLHGNVSTHENSRFGNCLLGGSTVLLPLPVMGRPRTHGWNKPIGLLFEPADHFQEPCVNWGHIFEFLQGVVDEIFGVQRFRYLR